MYILLKDHITTDDILCAYVHAVLLSIIICAINDVPLVRIILFAFLLKGGSSALTSDYRTSIKNIRLLM